MTKRELIHRICRDCASPPLKKPPAPRREKGSTNPRVRRRSRRTVPWR